jgi:hypothetical protein
MCSAAASARASRHDQRVQDDLTCHETERMQPMPAFAVGQRDQQRHDRKQKDAVAAEDQRGRRGGPGTEHGQRQAGAHIADIAVAAGKARQRRLAERQPPDQPARNHGEGKGTDRAEGGGDQEWRVVEFLKRRLRGDAEQQRRQRDIEQEEVHPGQTLLRKALGLAAGVADEDQAEIRQREIENGDHGETSLFIVVGPDRQWDGSATAKVNSAVCL